MNELKISVGLMDGIIIGVKRKVGANSGEYVSIAVEQRNTKKVYYKNYFVNAKNEKARQINQTLLATLKFNLRAHKDEQLVGRQVKFNIIEDDYNNIYKLDWRK